MQVLCQCLTIQLIFLGQVFLVFLYYILCTFQPIDLFLVIHGYDPLEVNPKDMVYFAMEEPRVSHNDTLDY